MKLYTSYLDHFLYMYPQMVRNYTNQRDIETVVASKEMQETPEFKAKRAHGFFPMMELDDGSMVYESVAQAQYIARRSQSHGASLTGFDAFEEGQINQWVHLNMEAFSAAVGVAYNMWGHKYDLGQFNASAKALKQCATRLNSALKGKTFLVGQRLTLADLANFVPMTIAFTFQLDAGFRKAHPNVAEWFVRVSQQSAVLQTAGNMKMCEKAMKPVDITKLPKEVIVAPVAKTLEEQVEAPKEEKKAEDDEFDPFADDDEEDAEAEAAKMAEMKEKAKLAKSYGKAKPIAKSIVVWEVKPWGEETDLDELAKMILGIEMDGLFWKTEYKKEPIAYGVFKIAIGATIEDDKVSTDLVQEKIEEFEDHVQSVDIQSFNKL